MGATRNKRRYLTAVAATIAVAAGSVAANAATFGERSLGAGVSHDLDQSGTTPPTWPSVPTTECTTTPCEVALRAGAGLLNAADNGVPDRTAFWGFGVNGHAVALAGAEGSIIKVPVGTTLHIALTQDPGTGDAIDLQFPSLTNTTKNATDGTYTVVADRVGTMVFQPGVNNDAPRQIAMGMVGVLIVTPSTADANCASCAYAADAAFDDEAIVALTDIDPVFAQDPLHADMSYFGQARDADGSAHTVYHMIDGKQFPVTDLIDARAGDRVLLRYVNASVADKYMGLLGLEQTLLGRNTSQLTEPMGVVTARVGAGETAEATVDVPIAVAAGQKYSLMEQGREMNAGTAAGFGGALTFVDVWTGGLPRVTDLDYKSATDTLTGTAVPTGATKQITAVRTFVGPTPPADPQAWTATTIADALAGTSYAFTNTVTGVAPGAVIWVEAQQTDTVSAAAVWSEPFAWGVVSMGVQLSSWDPATDTVTATVYNSVAALAGYQTVATPTSTPPTDVEWAAAPSVALSGTTFTLDTSAFHGQWVWVRVVDTNGVASAAANAAIGFSAPTIDTVTATAMTAALDATVTIDPLLTASYQFAITALDTDTPTWSDPATPLPADGVVHETLATTHGQWVWLRVTDTNPVTPGVVETKVQVADYAAPVINTITATVDTLTFAATVDPALTGTFQWALNGDPLGAAAPLAAGDNVVAIVAVAGDTVHVTVTDLNGTTVDASAVVG